MCCVSTLHTHTKTCMPLLNCSFFFFFFCKSACRTLSNASAVLAQLLVYMLLLTLFYCIVLVHYDLRFEGCIAKFWNDQ